MIDCVCGLILNANAFSGLHQNLYARKPLKAFKNNSFARSCWSDAVFNAFRLRKREREDVGNTPNLKFRSFAPFQIPIGNINNPRPRKERQREKIRKTCGGSSERTCCQNETNVCFKTFVLLVLLLCIVHELWRVIFLAFCTFFSDWKEEIWAESQERDAKRFWRGT